jgi:hypothetical protein
MSTEYWGIKMYGIKDSDLKFKPIKQILQIQAVEDFMKDVDKSRKVNLNVILEEVIFGGYNEAAVILPNGKQVFIDATYVEEYGYNYVYGFSAGYPWEKYMQGITKDDVHDALWCIFGEYLDMTKAELIDKCEEISTYNCG